MSKDYELVIASSKGGEAPPDPDSVVGWVDQRKEEPSIKFYNTKKSVWENTAPLSTFLGKTEPFVAVFYAGGHGPSKFCLPSLRNSKIRARNLRKHSQY